jgi:chorismate mutase/prephenate dehydratase
MMADLKELRSRIDEIDEELVRLFQERMDVAVEIGQHKQENGLPVFDPAREREKLHALSGQAKKGREADITALYSLIFELSRAAQERVVCPEAFRQI